MQCCLLTIINGLKRKVKRINENLGKNESVQWKDEKWKWIFGYWLKIFLKLNISLLIKLV